MVEDRKGRRTKTVIKWMAVLAFAGVLGYETISKMITVAVQKVTPVMLAQLESDVQKISNPTCPPLRLRQRSK